MVGKYISGSTLVLGTDAPIAPAPAFILPLGHESRADGMFAKSIVIGKLALVHIAHYFLRARSRHGFVLPPVTV
jgi:hypothetical protein